MRIAYSISLICLILFSVSALVKLRNEKEKTARYIKQILFCSVFCMAACMGACWSQTWLASQVCCSLQFFAFTWVIWYFFLFSLEFTGNSSGKIKVFTGILCGLQSISWFLNIFYQHLFTTEEFLWATDGCTYRILLRTELFLWQTSPMFLLAAVMVVVLMVKTFEAPRMFRIKYGIVLFMIISVIALHAVYLNFRIPMDWSAVFLVPFALGAWYLSDRFTLSNLQAGTLSAMADRMETGLVLFDYADRCVYVNRLAEELMGCGMEGCLDLMEKWYETRKASQLEQHEREISFLRNGGDVWLTVAYERLLDKNQEYLGCCFTLKDATEQAGRRAEKLYRDTHDSMTNLLNGDGFDQECARLLRENPEENYVVVQAVMDSLESIGDIYGLDTRNALISAMADVIRRCCGEKACAGRLGGASFAMLLPRKEFADQEVMQKLRRAMLEIMGDNGKIFNCRMGVAEVYDRSSTLKTLINRTKVAISQIRDSDSQISWYSSGMREQGLLDNSLSEELPAAIRNGELKMYLQAELDREGKIAGAEALVRWHRNGIVLRPGQFLPLFEKNEQIVDVDRYIWQQACACLKKWKDEGHGNLFICVNISRKELYLLNLTEELLQLVRDYGLDPSRLQIDFSAEVLAAEGSRMNEIVKSLQNAGFTVNLDNFGSAHSSPIVLKDAHFNGVKICRDLIRGIETDAAGRAITRAMLDICRQTGIETTAEGIETERELKSLRTMGCSYYQGFFISEPITIGEFETSFLGDDAVNRAFTVTESADGTP